MPKLELELSDAEWSGFLSLGGAEWLIMRLQYAGPGEGDKARSWLHDKLLDGRKPAAQIQAEAIAVGMSLTTLGRVKRSEGVISERDGWGPGAVWYWRLPEIGSADAGI